MLAVAPVIYCGRRRYHRTQAQAKLVESEPVGGHHWYATSARPSRAALLASRTKGSCSYRDPALWHCRPDKPLDSCRSHTGVSSVDSDGEVAVTSFAQVGTPPVDCSTEAKCKATCSEAFATCSDGVYFCSASGITTATLDTQPLDFFGR